MYASTIGSGFNLFYDVVDHSLICCQPIKKVQNLCFEYMSELFYM